MTVRLMHLADLHLGAPLSYLGDKAAQRSQELESALMRALDLAQEMSVHAIIIAGDLFDSFDPPPELVARVKAAFRKTSDAGTPIILIPGTHDSHRYSRCVYRKTEFPGVDILFDPGKPIRKNLGGREVYFYGFSGGGKSGGGASVFHRGPDEGLHIALVHGPVSEGTHWTPSSRDFPLSPSELEESGFDYIALGHYHNFREYRRGKSTAVYPGTLEGLKFGEDGDRHLLIAELNEGDVALERIKHNRRTLSQIRIDLTVSDMNSVDELITAIGSQSDPEGIVRVTLAGAANFIPTTGEIEAQSEQRFFHIEVSDETSVIGSGLIRSIANEETVRGIFVRKMLDRIERRSGEERATAELALRLAIEQFMRISDENSQDFN